MPYNLPGGPTWTAADFTNALEKGVAAFAQANGIATQTAWTTFIGTLTTAQATAVVKQILGTVTCSAP